MKDSTPPNQNFSVARKVLDYLPFISKNTLAGIGYQYLLHVCRLCKL